MLYYLIGQFAVVSKCTDNTAYIKQWSCTERIILFDIDIVVKNCGQQHFDHCD